MATIDRYPTVTLDPSGEDAPQPRPGRADELSTFGRGLTAKGRLSATAHVIIEGTVEGEVVVPDHGVAVTGIARVRGDVFARTVTVLGRVDGNLTASRLIELRASCVVSGKLSSPCLIIEEGARFRGPVDPGKTDSAIALARHRVKNT